MRNENLASKIVDYLFVNGHGQRAKRLVLELDNEKNGGGWSREAVYGVVLKMLSEFDKAEAQPVLSVVEGEEGEE